jgi:hypothetical protein
MFEPSSSIRWAFGSSLRVKVRMSNKKKNEGVSERERNRSPMIAYERRRGRGTAEAIARANAIASQRNCRAKAGHLAGLMSKLTAAGVRYEMRLKRK